MLDAGVDDEQGQPRCRHRQRHRNASAGPAVQQQRVAFLAEQDCQLIHQPGRGSDEVVLRAAAKRGHLRARHRQLAKISHRQPGRAL